MNISSILITIVGIIIILALYVAGRVSQSKMPKKEVKLLPEIKDENQNLVTSVLDDIPASEVSKLSKATTAENIKNTQSETSSASDNDSSSSDTDKTSKKVTDYSKQLILFISAKDDAGLDGDKIKEALVANGLVLGENDIYHFFPISQSQQKSSLFRVANGVEPWTLKDEDLIDQSILGLSLVMSAPKTDEIKPSLSIFLNKADEICKKIDGILKNDKQEVFTAEDRKALFNGLN